MNEQIKETLERVSKSIGMLFNIELQIEITKENEEEGNFDLEFNFDEEGIHPVLGLVMMKMIHTVLGESIHFLMMDKTQLDEIKEKWKIRNKKTKDENS